MQLFEEAYIGKLKLKNRIIGEPCVMQAVDSNYNLTDYGIKIYEERAKGGAALLIVEATAVNKGGLIVREPHPTFEKEEQKIVMKKVVEAIHSGGAKAGLQLVHAGRMANIPVAPSPVQFYFWTPRELTTEECDFLVEEFGRCACWAKEVGFDCVQLHAAHGWLIQQFLSPYTNYRKDKYGERTFFLKQIIRRTKEECGEDFPVIVRISGDEFIGEKGITIELTKKEIVPAIEEAGADLIDVSAGTLEPFRMHFFVQPVYQKRGVILYLAEEVKKVAKILVSGVGKLNTLSQMENALKISNLDFVGICRQLISDPYFPNKVKEKNYEKIKLCLSCDHCSPSTEVAKCAVNPVIGYGENLTAAEKIKKILIIGGGVAGLYCARICALRGHKVILSEKENQLGGILKFAAYIPNLRTRELFNIISYLKNEIKKLNNIEILLNTNIDSQLIKKINPHIIILATGSLPKNLSGVLTIEDYINKQVFVGNKVIVVGALYGAEIAASLSFNGKKVTLIENNFTRFFEGAPYFEEAIPYMSKARVFQLGLMLRDNNVKVYESAKVKEINKEKIIIEKNKQIIEIFADTIIYTDKRIPNNLLEEEIKNLNIPYHKIGDCVKPRNILSAVHEGYKVGCEI